MSALTTSHGLKAGDLVFVGKPAPLTDKVVWRITSIYQAAEGKVYAVLTSGMTERGRTSPIETLTRFTPRVSEPAHG